MQTKVATPRDVSPENLMQVLAGAEAQMVRLAKNLPASPTPAGNQSPRTASGTAPAALPSEPLRHALARLLEMDRQCAHVSRQAEAANNHKLTLAAIRVSSSLLTKALKILAKNPSLGETCPTPETQTTVAQNQPQPQARPRVQIQTHSQTEPPGQTQTKTPPKVQPQTRTFPEIQNQNQSQEQLLAQFLEELASPPSMGLEALHPPIDFAKILGTQPDKDHRKVESASPVFNIPQGSVQKVLQKEVR